jgi:hypothetical protein
MPIGAGSHGIWWYQANVTDLDEGYISCWLRCTNPQKFGVNDIWKAFYSTSSQIYCRFNGLLLGTFTVTRTAGGTTAQATVPKAVVDTLVDVWTHLEVRWSVSGNKLEVRFDEGTWYASATTLLPTANQPHSFYIQQTAGALTYVDNVEIYKGYTPPVSDPTIFYHYWVTAVDAYNYESDVTGPEDLSTPSYDSFTFLPPDIPEIVGTEIDMVHKYKVINLRSLYSYTVGWTSEDNTVWYQVRIAIKPPGKTNQKVEYNYGPWHYSAYLDESRIKVQSDEDAEGSAITSGLPVYTYPFPIQAGSYVKAQVRAINNAGPKWKLNITEEEQRWSTNGTGPLGEWIVGPIEGDTERPLAVTLFEGECYGIFWGTKYWMSVRLRWRPRPWYEGIQEYQILYRLGSTPGADWKEIERVPAKSVLVDTDEAPYQWVRQYHTFMANDIPLSTGENTIDFAIRPIDDNDNDSKEATTCTVTWESWWWPL